MGIEMYKLKVTSIMISALFITSNVNAAGLAEDVYNLQVKTKKIVKAVKANRAAISANADSIAANAAAINANSSAISGNTTDISTNTTAITTLSDKVSGMSAPVTYDYKNYSGQVISKTFQLQGDFGSCNETETRTYTRTVVGDATNLAVNRTRTSAGNMCHDMTFNYVLTSESKKLVSKDNNDMAGNVVSTYLLSAPFTVAKSSMVEGKSFGGATGLRNDVAYPGLLGGFVNTVTVEGLQDVTVPAGTFTGCLKIHTVRHSNGIGAFDRYSWHCPGIGEVKRNQVDPLNLAPRFWKLISYTQ